MDELRVSWGAGPDQVVQLARPEVEASPPPSDGEAVRIRGIDGWAIATSDPPLGGITIGWIEAGCAYRIVVMGKTWLEALDYAGRY